MSSCDCMFPTTTFMFTSPLKRSSGPYWLWSNFPSSPLPSKHLYLCRTRSKAVSQHPQCHYCWFVDADHCLNAATTWLNCVWPSSPLLQHHVCNSSSTTLNQSSPSRDRNELQIWWRKFSCSHFPRNKSWLLCNHNVTPPTNRHWLLYGQPPWRDLVTVRHPRWANPSYAVTPPWAEPAYPWSIPGMDSGDTNCPHIVCPSTCHPNLLNTIYGL